MFLRIILLALAMLLTPLVAHADYLDVITVRLKAGCSLDTYPGIVQEFRSARKTQGYKYTVEIADPVTGPDLSVIHWVGREPNFGTFGQDGSARSRSRAHPRPRSRRS